MSKRNKKVQRSRTKKESSGETDAQGVPQIVRREDIRRRMNPLWILSGVFIGFAGLLIAFLPHAKLYALWISYLGVIFGIAAVFVWLHAVIAELDRIPLALKLDSSTPHRSEATPPPLPTLSATPSLTPTPTVERTNAELPKATASATPKDRLTSITAEEIIKKLREARDRGNEEDVKQALQNRPVTWEMNFFRAERSGDGKEMRVTFQTGPFKSILVSVPLPVAGNEHFPLADQKDVFRVNGIIDDPNVLVIACVMRR